jgi:hypothetical protein
MNALSRAAALSAVLALSLPAPGAAQIVSQTHLLATMRQQISQGTISTVPIAALPRPQRRALLGEMTPRHSAALRDALDRAIVATDLRPNGVSSDQVTLAEYLQSMGIAPARVVAVTIATHVDRENPPVTVYYRDVAPRD